MYPAAEELPLSRAKNFTIDHRVRLSMGLFLGLIGVNILLGKIPANIASPADPWGAAGIGLILTGLALRSWAAGTICKGQRLTTWGPYRLCRHPLYLGSLLIMAGFCLLVPNPLNFVIYLGPAWILYLFTMQREEQRLAVKYAADWYHYASRTPRLLPRMLLGKLNGAWSGDQWVRRREYRAVLTSLLSLVALELCHSFLHVSGPR